MMLPFPYHAEQNSAKKEGGEKGGGKVVRTDKDGKGRKKDSAPLITLSKAEKLRKRREHSFLLFLFSRKLLPLLSPMSPLSFPRAPPLCSLPLLLLPSSLHPITSLFLSLLSLCPSLSAVLPPSPSRPLLLSLLLPCTVSMQSQMLWRKTRTHENGFCCRTHHF